MSKFKIIIACGCLLAGCVTTNFGPDPRWVAELKKAGQNPNAISLGNDPTAGTQYGIPTHAAAFAKVAETKGKQGSFIGYIWDLKLNGSTAEIEVMPNSSGANGSGCAGVAEVSRFNCLTRKRGRFTSNVTCHLNNWPKLDNATGNRIATHFENRWHNDRVWDHVLVEGTISHVEKKAAAFDGFVAVSSDFGVGGNHFKRGWVYSSIHLNNCRVLTYRGKAVAS